MTIVWVAAEKAGAAAIGHFGRDCGQSARPRCESVGSMSATRSIGLPDDDAAVGVEHQHLPEMGHHQQLIVAEKPWRQRHSDDLVAPADPLGGRIRQDQPGLADIKVVDTVEHRPGESAALDEPGAPALAPVVVVLPHHQRAAARRLGVGRQVAARAECHRRPEIALHRAGPGEFQAGGAGGGREAAVGRVGVLGRPALRRCGVDPRVGVAAARRGECRRASDHGRRRQRGESPKHQCRPFWLRM